MRWRTILPSLPVVLFFLLLFFPLSSFFLPFSSVILSCYSATFLARPPLLFPLPFHSSSSSPTPPFLFILFSLHFASFSRLFFLSSFCPPSSFLPSSTSFLHFCLLFLPPFLLFCLCSRSSLSLSFICCAFLSTCSQFLSPLLFLCPFLFLHFPFHHRLPLNFAFSPHPPSPHPPSPFSCLVFLIRHSPLLSVIFPLLPSLLLADLHPLPFCPLPASQSSSSFFILFRVSFPLSIFAHPLFLLRGLHIALLVSPLPFSVLLCHQHMPFIMHIRPSCFCCSFCFSLLLSPVFPPRAGSSFAALLLIQSHFFFFNDSYLLIFWMVHLSPFFLLPMQFPTWLPRSSFKPLSFITGDPNHTVLLPHLSHRLVALFPAVTERARDNW